jgi:hypothetical protein
MFSSLSLYSFLELYEKALVVLGRAFDVFVFGVFVLFRLPVCRLRRRKIF